MHQVAIRTHGGPAEEPLGGPMRTGSLLDFSDVRERTDYTRLVMFIMFLHDDRVVELLKSVMHATAGPMDDDEAANANDVLLASVRMVCGINADISLGTIIGGVLGRLPGTGALPSATTYSLNAAADAASDLRDLAGYARKLPAHIFPPEFIPTGEFIVRCEALAS